jgi:phage gp37-like protein
MTVLGALEDAIVARLAGAFGARVREVDHKPDRLDAEELSRILTMAPACYVALLGLPRRGVPQGVWIAQYGIYCVAQNASGERARRRGDAVTIGGYEMAELALRMLDDWAPAEAAGAVEIASIENLYAAAFEKAGRSVYALVAEIPVELPRGIDPATLGAFVTFDVSWDVPPLGEVSRPPPSVDRDAGDRILPPQ